MRVYLHSIIVLLFPSLLIEVQAIAWETSNTCTAPEAHQAAAADRDCLYAINNTHVAKYDRRTGKRIALSNGDAKHLNSGFLWKNRLLCAHSNFPQTPEQSQIKVLDLNTMQLSTWKDFGNYGGSLTWVIHDQNHWWCNFAKYGSENAKTFLVKFDQDWKEKGRWLYPKSVIKRLGSYSLSGGLWRNGELIVTGHDDPILFRLQVPKTGKTLRFLGTESVPFTGQGIGVDPLTGGLIGIHRQKKQLVLATPKSKRLQIRILSYNIHHGEGIDKKLDLKRIAEVIQSLKPDLVALQEVDKKTKRTQRVDQLKVLSAHTSLKGVFGGNIKFEGGDYGNAVLSRWPIVEHKNHKLPNIDKGEQRGILEVVIALPESKEKLVFWATHLDHRRNPQERIESAKAINKLIEKQSEALAILAGDLNATPNSEPLKEFAKKWMRTNKTILPTIPVKKPSRQIDYVLIRPESRWKVIETKVLSEAVASDHRAILAVLELLPLEK